MAQLDIEASVLFNGNAMVYEDQAPLVGLNFYNETKTLNDAQKLDITKEVAALVSFHLGWLAPKPTLAAASPSQAALKLQAMAQLAREYPVVSEMLTQFEEGYCNGRTKEEIAKIVFDKIVFGNRYLRERYGEIKCEQREQREAT